MKRTISILAVIVLILAVAVSGADAESKKKKKKKQAQRKKIAVAAVVSHSAKGQAAIGAQESGSSMRSLKKECEKELNPQKRMKCLEARPAVSQSNIRAKDCSKIAGPKARAKCEKGQSAQAAPPVKRQPKDSAVEQPMAEMAQWKRDMDRWESCKLAASITCARERTKRKREACEENESLKCGGMPVKPSKR